MYVLTGMGGAVALRTSILSGDGTTTSFGLGLTLVGDYDADGVFDYAVGSAGSSSGQGAVRVFRGPFGPVNLTPAYTLMGSGTGVRFGQRVALRSPRRWHLAHLLAER